MLGNLSNGVYCIIYGLLYPYLGVTVGAIVSWVFSLFPSAIPFGIGLYWRNKAAEKERYTNTPSCCFRQLIHIT